MKRLPRTLTDQISDTIWQDIENSLHPCCLQAALHLIARAHLSDKSIRHRPPAGTECKMKYRGTAKCWKGHSLILSRQTFI